MNGRKANGCRESVNFGPSLRCPTWTILFTAVLTCNSHFMSFTHLSVYNSVGCGTFIELCNHHHSVILEHFIIPKGNPIPMSNQSPSLPLSTLCQSTYFSSSSVESSTFMGFFYNHHHHPPPERFNHLTLKLCPH